MPRKFIALRSLPWTGKLQAAAIIALVLLTLVVGYAVYRIQHVTRQLRAQIATQTAVHEATERLQKNMLREHLALLEFTVTHDDSLFSTRHHLRHRAFHEMSKLLASPPRNASVHATVQTMAHSIQDYFQMLDRAPNRDISEMTLDLHRIERLGDKVLADTDSLMDKESADMRNSLTFERQITFWVGGFLALMLLFALGYGLSLIRPMRELLQAIGRIKSGDFNFQIPVRRKDDVGKLAYSFNSMVREVHLRQQQLIQESVTDSLTGVYNSKYFWTSLRAMADEARKMNKAFSVLMIDIDHFKQFNDRYGHEFGNAVIKMTVAIIKQNLRGTDILARYGGDEFIAILPNTNAHDGAELAQRIQSVADSAYFPSLKTGALSELTLSIGGATFSAAMPSLEALVGQADNALYEAKNAGRACVRWGSGTPAEDISLPHKIAL